MPPKKCDTFCKKVFVKERENVEAKFAKEHGIKYVPLDKMANKTLAKAVKDRYVATCNEIYCNKKCGFIDTVKKDKPRMTNLRKQGAISACRDLVSEFPKYYSKKKV